MSRFLLPSVENDTKKYLPYPEAIDDGDWTIEDGPGTAVRSKRGPGGTVAVPTTSSDYDRVRRVRALVAGKHSPQQWREIPGHIQPEMLMVAETMRIGAITRRELIRQDHDLRTALLETKEDGDYKEELEEILGVRESALALLSPFIADDVAAGVKTAARDATTFLFDYTRAYLDQITGTQAISTLAGSYEGFVEERYEFGCLPLETRVDEHGVRQTEGYCTACRDAWDLATSDDEKKRIEDPNFHFEQHLLHEDGELELWESVDKSPDKLKTLNRHANKWYSILSVIERITNTLDYSYGRDREHRGLMTSDHRTSVRVAEILQELIEDHERADKKYRRTFDKGKSESDDPGETETGEGEGEGEAAEGEAAEGEKGEEALPPSISEEDYNRDLEDGIRQLYRRSPESYIQGWGEFNLVKLPLDRLMPARLTSPSRRFSDRGVIPSAIHRWCSDQQIFTTKRRAAGGSVLVDVSGSMSLTNEDIYQILESIPAGIIGIYSSNGGSGHLRIVAEGGRMVERYQDLDHGPRATRSKSIINYGGGNGIDGPSLEWLGQQVFPRVWISDGVVTGAQEEHTVDIVKDTERLVRKHKIIRVDDLEHALKTMEVYT